MSVTGFVIDPEIEEGPWNGSSVTDWSEPGAF